jgi:lysine biosynthesis protein LysW
MVADCVSCGAQIKVGNKPALGQQFRCPNCGDTMEVVWLDPVELDWPVDDEDYDDDDYDDED